MAQSAFGQQSPDASPLSTPESLENNVSASSTHSRGSRRSPSTSGVDDETLEWCPHPQCGRYIKDLKAHTITHQTERPEKCPIVSCEYHTKGFARSYDRIRHTLVHYRGILVCGFCPQSRSPTEKSFRRADVFKRHLTAVHGVEQTPPNRRQNNSNSEDTMAYSSDSTGKCSTCSGTFSNPQGFYEHLDDCVLRAVQQEESSKATN